jgi:putative ABC transport system permease protein
MLFLQTIISAIDSLLKNKKRTFMTIFGFAVGVALVIVVLSVGSFCSEVINLYYSGIEESKYLEVKAYEKVDRTKIKSFSLESCNEYNEKLPEYVYGIYFSSEEEYKAISFCKEKKYDTVLNGGSALSTVMYQLTTECGRFISNLDCNESRKVAIIPDTIAEDCYGSNENALNNSIFIKCENDNFIECTIIGVYRTLKDDNSNSMKNKIYVPYTTVNEMLGLENKKEFTELKVLYRYGKISEDNAMRHTINFFNEKYKDANLMVYPSVTQSEESVRMVKYITAMFVFFSSIVFLVSGIGLTNTLLISVTERTFEIGIRKAIGAPNSLIKWQFMWESLIVCVVACAIGIGLGFVMDFLLESNIEHLLMLLLDEKYSNIITSAEIPLQPKGLSIFIVVLVSLLLGRIFGGYPARKAMKMQPVEALRYQ